MWCRPAFSIMLKAMKHAKQQTRQVRTPPEAAASVRASVSFSPEAYRTLEEIARQKKVSLAWVVRDAVEQYVAEKWPLFKGQG
jgi:hypothetical protein